MGNLLQKQQTISNTTADPPWRGCAAKYPQPLSPTDVQGAQSLVDKIFNVNCSKGNLKEIVYRTGEKEKDIQRQVFRWDLAPYDKVFQQGFQVQKGKKKKKPNILNYNLSTYVNGSTGRPLDSRKKSSFAFISSTVSNSWYPPVPSGKTIEVYRYEVYAPGGIWTSLTLGGKDSNKFKRLDEVAFVGGIAPQYIRSAQLFRLTGNSNG